MKKILVIIVCLCILSCGTTQPTGNQPKRIIDIKKFSGLKKAKLYEKSMLWAGKSYVKANEVIQYKDKKAGKIVCQGISCIPSVLYENCFNYTLTISVKDGKIRTCFENLRSRITRQGTTQVAGVNFSYQWKEILSNIHNIRDSLYNDIRKESKEEDW